MTPVHEELSQILRVNLYSKFHLGRYNRRIYCRKFSFSVAVNVIFERISDDIPPKENFEYGCPLSNALLQFYLNFERYMPHKAACH